MKLALHCLAGLLLLLILSYFLGFNFLISSFSSFLLSLLIVFSSYNAYYNKIIKNLYDTGFEISQDDENGKDDERAEMKKNRVFSSYFSPLRLFCYFLFALSFFALAKFQLLNVFGIILGVVVMQLTIFIYGFINAKSS